MPFPFSFLQNSTFLKNKLKLYWTLTLGDLPTLRFEVVMLIMYLLFSPVHFWIALNELFWSLVQRKKFIDESKSLMENISKLEELLSSRNNILQVWCLIDFSCWCSFGVPFICSFYYCCYYYYFFMWYMNSVEAIAMPAGFLNLSHGLWVRNAKPLCFYAICLVMSSMLQFFLVFFWYSLQKNLGGYGYC